MKRVFAILAAALMAFAFVACTEKEKIEPENGSGTTNPPAPQHNSLYQTRWAGTAEQTLTVPIIGDVTFTIDNNVEFQTDSTASSLIHVTAGNIISRDTNVACTYTWNDPDGVLTAVKNPQMSIDFHKTSADTINITIYKSDLIAMWSQLNTVSSYLPESFSIDLIKQD